MLIPFVLPITLLSHNSIPTLTLECIYVLTLSSQLILSYA